jgi:hypothetical protein
MIHLELCEGRCTTRKYVAKIYKVLVDTRMSGGIGYIERKVGNSVDISIFQFEKYIPCSCRCVIHCTEHHTHGTQQREH